jgi:hypothetical protein
MADTSGIFRDIFQDWKPPEKDIVGQLSDAYTIWQDYATGKDLSTEEQKAIEAFNKYSGAGGPGMVVSHGTRHFWPGGLKGKFDLSNLGRGEGGALYNRGAYLAQDPRLGSYYRDATSGQMTGAFKTSEGVQPADFIIGPLREDILGILKKGGVDPTSDVAKGFSRDLRDSYLSDVGAKKPLKDFEDLLRWKLDNAGPWTKHGLGIDETMTKDEFIKLLTPLVDKYTPIRNGYLYKLDLPDKEIARFLDLDSMIKSGSQHPDTLAKVNEYIADSISNSSRVGNKYLTQNTSQGPQNINPKDLYQLWEDYKSGNRMTNLLGSNDYWSLIANPRNKGLVTLNPLGAVPGRVGTKPIGNPVSNMPFSAEVRGQSTFDRLFGENDISKPADIRGSSFTGNDFQHWANQVNRSRRMDTSEQLDVFGIKGNKFLDASSRPGNSDYDPRKRKPTRNFVIWNQKLLDSMPILQIRGLWD